MSAEKRTRSTAASATGWTRWKAALENDTWVKPFFTQYRRAMLASLGLGLLTMVFASALMFASGYLIDLSAERPELGVWSLFVPLAFVQLFGIGRPFLGYSERLVSHDWVLHMTSELRRRLYRSIDAGGMVALAAKRTGEALGLLSEDIGHVQDLYLRSIFPQVVACALWLLLSLGLGLFSPLMGLVTLFVVGTLVLFVPLAAALVDGARRMQRAQVDAQLYTEVYDNVEGVADWTFAQRGEEYVERVMASYRSKAEVDGRLAAADRLRTLAVQGALCALSAGIVVWAAVHFGSAAQSAAAIGDISRPVDWLAAFALGFFPLIEAFAPLSAGAVQMSAHLDSVRRLNEQGPPDAVIRTEKGPHGAPDGFDISFDGVHFAYPGEKREVLDGVDLQVPAGQKLALLGPSGAGKSTLLALLRGDRRPSEGSVSLCGVETSLFGDEAADYMSVIQQETYLFNQTLLDNVRMGDAGITEEQALAALEQVGLASLLAKLDCGIQTVVDEVGLSFSGGERHRIALARALLRDTPIVLLDEPCVSLDPVTEAALLETVMEVLDGRTVIMVTHHLLGVSHMDRVVFLEDGHVGMDGTPSDLVRGNERYCRLLSFDAGSSGKLKY